MQKDVILKLGDYEYYKNNFIHKWPMQIFPHVY